MERHDAIIQGESRSPAAILMTTIALVAGMTPLVLSSGRARDNRSIGVLVVRQSLCLLLTLLAVPVFYSCSTIWRAAVWSRIGGTFTGIFGRARRRAARQRRLCWG